MADWSEHNLSKPSKGNEHAPIPQHKRLALGEKGVTGQTNPYGAKTGDRSSKVANGKNY